MAAFKIVTYTGITNSNNEDAVQFLEVKGQINGYILRFIFCFVKYTVYIIAIE